MSRILSILFFLQISLVLTFAQITFTREWVTGKRAGLPNSLVHRKENCVSFMPTIEFLMEIEQIQKKDCGLGLKMSPLSSWKNGEELSRRKGEDSYEPGTGTFTAKA